jgi:hypothetical protein
MKYSKRKRNRIRNKKSRTRGGGNNKLKTNDNYYTCDKDCNSNPCFVNDSDKTNLFPPFNGDNEIYIWINDRCRKDARALFENIEGSTNVKIKRTVLRSIWGHCAFSFDPDKGPIYGYGPDLLPILKDYAIIINGNIIDNDGYITFSSYDKFIEFKTYFENISYTGNNIQLIGKIGEDTMSFKDIANLTDCSVYRFTLFTNKNTNGRIEDLGINLGNQTDSLYGIYKNNDVCYGNFNGQNIYNCITYIINYFDPYYYEKVDIHDKCVFKKVSMNIFGKYCASIYMTIEVLKKTLHYDVFTINNTKPTCLL